MPTPSAEKKRTGSLKRSSDDTRFRSLIEKSTDIIVVIDGEGKIVYSSPSVEHYFGISDKENAGKSAFEYIHPEDLSRLAIEFLELLEHPGLKLSIEDLVESIRRLSDDLRIKFDFSLPAEEQLDDKLKMTIFRIIQEQLNNVLKHARASRIHIAIRQDEKALYLQVNDNGKGFDIRKKRKGIGIANIINRAEVFNGQVTIDSAPGKGCRMSVEFHLHAHTASDAI